MPSSRLPDAVTALCCSRTCSNAAVNDRDNQLQAASAYASVEANTGSCPSHVVEIRLWSVHEPPGRVHTSTFRIDNKGHR